MSSECPDCGERVKVLRTGRNYSFLVVGEQGPDLTLDAFDGREWQSLECAACGRMLDQQWQPLGPPETGRRIVH